jgi:2-hydroxy-3-oxopropionate reductase
MGAPMAATCSSRAPLFVHTRSKVPPPGLASGATPAPRAEVAERADIVFLMLPDTPDVEKVLFGENGVASGLTRARPWWT